MKAAQRILKRCGLTRAQIARDTGLNEATVWSWVKGKWAPSPESLAKLAAGLEKRGRALIAMAEELRRAAREEGE